MWLKRKYVIICDEENISLWLCDDMCLYVIRKIREYIGWRKYVIKCDEDSYKMWVNLDLIFWKFSI